MNWRMLAIAGGVVTASAGAQEGAELAKQPEKQVRLAQQKDCQNSQPTGTGWLDAEFGRALDFYGRGRYGEAADAADTLINRPDWARKDSLTPSQEQCLRTTYAAARKFERDYQAAGQLRDVYMNYIAMQACYDSRKEYRVPYVSQQEVNNARTITRRDETTLLQKDLGLSKQKDAVWEAAKRDYGTTTLALILGASGTSHNSQVAQLCRLTAMKYNADQGQQQQQIKKDF